MLVTCMSFGEVTRHRWMAVCLCGNVDICSEQLTSVLMVGPILLGNEVPSVWAIQG